MNSVPAWQIPIDTFVGVPYLYRYRRAPGEKAQFVHPHQLNEVSAARPPGSLKYILPAQHVPPLPAQFSIAAISIQSGFGLFCAGEAIGLYVERDEGYLLALAKMRGKQLGAQFLAACLTCQTPFGGLLPWRPGTYSDAGLFTTLRAHRLIVDQAIRGGKAVPGQVRSTRAWTPATWPGMALAPGDVPAIAHYAADRLTPLEATVALYMLGDDAVELFGMVPQSPWPSVSLPTACAVRIRGRWFDGFGAVDEAEWQRACKAASSGDVLKCVCVGSEVACRLPEFRRDVVREFLAGYAAAHACSP